MEEGTEDRIGILGFNSQTVRGLIGLTEEGTDVLEVKVSLDVDQTGLTT